MERDIQLSGDVLGLPTQRHEPQNQAPRPAISPIQRRSNTSCTGKTSQLPFLAPDCADVILTAGTKYWIVFAGTGYKPVVTDTNDQLTNRSGWFIANVAATKTASPWSDLAGGGTIAVQIWASRR